MTNITRLIFIFFAASSCIEHVIASSAYAHEQDEINMTFNGRIHESKTVLIRLHLPYKSMFRDEKPWLVYGIRNTGNDDVFLTNDVIGMTSVGHIQDAQMWFQFGKGDQYKWNFHPAIGRSWKRMIENRENMQPLKSGYTVVVSSREGSFFYNSTALGQEKVRGALLINENQYIASNWCDIKISPKSLKEGAEFIEVDYGSSVYKAPLYINSLDGERWIFIQDYRISKVPDGTQPAFDIDKGSSIMTISFKGGNYDPVIHDIKTIRTLSGPKELVPHLYLQKEMKAILGEMNYPAVITEGEHKAETGASATERSVQGSANQLSWVLLTGVGAILLVAIGVLARKRLGNRP